MLKASLCLAISVLFIPSVAYQHRHGEGSDGLVEGLEVERSATALQRKMCMERMRYVVRKGIRAAWMVTQSRIDKLRIFRV